MAKCPQKRLNEWREIAPEQIWYCEKCNDWHVPDWNCTKSFVYHLKDSSLEGFVKWMETIVKQESRHIT